MGRFSLFSSYVKDLRDTDRGAISLVLVLGGSLVLLIITAMVAGQARQEIRMAIAERDAAKVRAIVSGAFNEAAVLAETDPTFPGTDPLAGGFYCTPQPSFTGAAYPRSCRQVLPSRLVESEMWGTIMQYPVRVVWQVSPSSEPQATYGWILADQTDLDPTTGRPKIRGVWYDHKWCSSNPDYLVGGSPLGPCKAGG